MGGITGICCIWKVWGHGLINILVGVPVYYTDGEGGPGKATGMIGVALMITMVQFSRRPPTRAMSATGLSDRTEHSKI